MIIVGIQFFTLQPKKTSRRHFPALPLVSPRNNVWQTSAEISCWPRVTTQMWMVLLIGWSKLLSWHNQSGAYPGLGSENVISISALVPQTCFRGELAALALHNVSYHSRFFDALTNLPQLFKRCIALSSRQITIQRISSREINCVTDWIVIYPMDSVIHLFINWAPVLLISVSTISTSVTSHLIWYRQTNISPWKVHNMLVLFRCILSKLSYFYFS